jgi:hypothetical protein
MRLIVMAILLALVIGPASAASLQGSDANATVVLFGSIRTPVADENSTLEILMVDVGLIGAKNATYQLIDQNDTVYGAGLYKPLSSGKLSSGAETVKQTVYFLTEKDSLFKLINVTPDGEAPIYINWWATPKASNNRLVLRYYGIVNSQANSDEQAIVVQARVKNNGTENLYVSPENFTLLDQWGWPYRPTLGFDAENVGPNSATSERVLIGFTGISPASRPAALAYDYGASDQIVIDFDRDYVPLSDEVVYGTAAMNGTAGSAASSASTSAATAVPAAAVHEASTESQVATTQTTAAAASENATSKISSLKERVAAAKANLAATREDLDKKTPDANDTTNTSESALNSSSSIPA